MLKRRDYELLIYTLPSRYPTIPLGTLSRSRARLELDAA